MTPSAHSVPAHVARLIALFETLTPQSLAGLADIYAADAQFKDPFNDVQGLDAIRGVFEHMFVALQQPRFVITRQVTQGGDCFITWDFYFYLASYQRGVEQKIAGASHLVFDAEGRVQVHRDYWDAAEELYEKLPLVGSLMRWLKRRANS
jgi:ketosteroid isomerase-like protein